jgi:hypothetical protein
VSIHEQSVGTLTDLDSFAYHATVVCPEALGNGGGARVGLVGREEEAKGEARHGDTGGGAAEIQEESSLENNEVIVIDDTTPASSRTERPVQRSRGGTKGEDMPHHSPLETYIQEYTVIPSNINRSPSTYVTHARTPSTVVQLGRGAGRVTEITRESLDALATAQAGTQACTLTFATHVDLRADGCAYSALSLAHSGGGSAVADVEAPGAVVPAYIPAYISRRRRAAP